MFLLNFLFLFLPKYKSKPDFPDAGIVDRISASRNSAATAIKAESVLNLIAVPEVFHANSLTPSLQSGKIFSGRRQNLQLFSLSQANPDISKGASNGE
jgi:hypothetical protein